MAGEPVVIADAGPLIALAEIGQLQLLPALFGRLLIPPAVQAEILREPTASALTEALDAGWVVVRTPQDENAVHFLRNDLDAGESEAIVLAREVSPQWIILDDLAARHIAEAAGLPVMGTLGVLLKAKEAGHLSRL